MVEYLISQIISCCLQERVKMRR